MAAPWRRGFIDSALSSASCSEAAAEGATRAPTKEGECVVPEPPLQLITVEKYFGSPGPAADGSTTAASSTWPGDGGADALSAGSCATTSPKGSESE